MATKYEDVDGIDGPWERALKRSMREDARARRARCKACGNHGCPKVDDAPFLERCPAAERVEV